MFTRVLANRTRVRFRIPGLFEPGTRKIHRVPVFPYLNTSRHFRCAFLIYNICPIFLRCTSIFTWVLGNRTRVRFREYNTV